MLKLLDFLHGTFQGIEPLTLWLCNFLDNHFSAADLWGNYMWEDAAYDLVRLTFDGDMLVRPSLYARTV